MVLIIQCKNLGIRIEFLGTCHKLTYGSVLNYNHRLLGCSKPAHLHCSADKGKCFTCAYFMGKQQWLHRTTDDSLRLMWTHLELMVCSAKVLRCELVTDCQRYIVVELLVVDAFYMCRHFCITMHLFACPFLEVGSNLINLCSTSLRRFLVGDGLCRFT